MIYDKLDNLETYADISGDIRLGLEYLRQVSPDVENGVYNLSHRVKAIVSEYMTKAENENGYEAHRQYIDIQCPVRGVEKVRCLPIEYMKEMKAYREDIDAAFYKEAGVPPQEMIIGNGYFAIFFPQDSHEPQLYVEKQDLIKKITIKVMV